MCCIHFFYKFQSAETRVILKSPILQDLSMQTLSSYCLVPMIRNSVLLSFSCYRSVVPCIGFQVTEKL